MVKVNVYVPWYNKNHTKILIDFAHGCNGKICDVRHWEPGDVSVIFGGVKKSYQNTWTKKHIIEKTLEAGGRMMFMEEGFVRRGEYYSLGWNDINNRAMFHNECSPSDRWEALNIKLKKKNQSKRYLICGQVPWDVNVQDTKHQLWCRTLFYTMKEAGHDVMFRPHPRMVNNPRAQYGIAKEWWDTRPLDICLKDYGTVMTYNSNIGVDAVIAGCTPVASDGGSMVWDFHKKGRKQWAQDIAYAQWNLEELRNGKAWQHLSRGAEL